MSRAALVLPLVFLTGCTHDDPRPTNRLLGTRPLVIGHRGAAAVAPENTLAAFRVARELGVAFELDVTMSADGRVVVIHDDTLDRTTGAPGFVDETPWARVAGLDAGAWFGDAFAGEPVPTLDMVFEQIGGTVPIDIEIKSPRDRGRAAELAGLVLDCIEKHGMAERVFITSFNPMVLAAVRERAPDIPRGQIIGTFEGSDVSRLTRHALQNMWLNRRADADIVVGQAAFLTPERMQQYQAHGYRVMAWVINEEAEVRRMLDMGVMGIITDDPAMALRVVAAVAEDAPPE
jgi:glycerophosphoryl diester phosphodiesterase